MRARSSPDSAVMALCSGIDQRPNRQAELNTVWLSLFLLLYLINIISSSGGSSIAATVAVVVVVAEYVKVRT